MLPLIFHSGKVFLSFINLGKRRKNDIMVCWFDIKVAQAKRVYRVLDIMLTFVFAWMTLGRAKFCWKFNSFRIIQIKNNIYVCSFKIEDFLLKPIEAVLISKAKIHLFPFKYSQERTKWVLDKVLFVVEKLNIVGVSSTLGSSSLEVNAEIKWLFVYIYCILT